MAAWRLQGGSKSNSMSYVGIVCIDLIGRKILNLNSVHICRNHYFMPLTLLSYSHYFAHISVSGRPPLTQIKL